MVTYIGLYLLQFSLGVPFQIDSTFQYRSVTAVKLCIKTVDVNSFIWLASEGKIALETYAWWVNHTITKYFMHIAEERGGGG